MLKLLADLKILLLSQVDEVGGSRDIELPRLSQQLLLDSLWNTLSECLQVTSISIALWPYVKKY
jgi:hypothetical protein